MAVANAIAAIRVSSAKQGTNGDSPEAQHEQIERFASSRNITIKKFFVFLESASKEQQPMQEAIDYCKDPKNNINQFIIKSIDRFTRNGSYSYDGLKQQLDACKVDLVDIYGVISNQKVNTLEHLGFKYRWSEYSPSKKSEMLEAERAKDEMRDIMSRMIGAEIRYTQMGYWMHQQPYGYSSKKLETQNGKRCILIPHPDESQLIIKMFELKATGIMSDQEIVTKLDEIGFLTHVTLVRDKDNRTKVIGQRGGKRLTIKKLNYYIQNPIYAGVIKETWTENKAIKARFDALVSFDLFNKANRGNLLLHTSSDGDIEFIKRPPLEYRSRKDLRAGDFPYKKFVTCSVCNSPLLGSASRGRMGKYYPAYHCSHHGHYFRIPKQEFDETISTFVKSLVVKPAHLDAVLEAVVRQWDKQQATVINDTAATQKRLVSLEAQTRLIIDKIKILNSETAIKYMEEDLMKLESEMSVLRSNVTEQTVVKKPVDIRVITSYVRYYVEHLHELLVDLSNPAKKAAYFSVLFDAAPSYQEIECGTKKIAQIPGVNELFSLIFTDNSDLVRERRLELPRPEGH